MQITMTDIARAYIKKKIEDSQAIGFRLSIKKTGCAGFSYVPAIVEKTNETDRMIDIDGISFFIDAHWQSLLNGLHIDYVEDMKTGLKQKRLVFTNPNEASRCGCGESFHVE